MTVIIRKGGWLAFGRREFVVFLGIYFLAPYIHFIFIFLYDKTKKSMRNLCVRGKSVASLLSVYYLVFLLFFISLLLVYFAVPPEWMTAISLYPKYPFPVIFDNGKWLKRPAVHVCKCQP